MITSSAIIGDADDDVYVHCHRMTSMTIHILELACMFVNFDRFSLIA